MRVDFTNFGLEPPENSKPGRAGQTGTAPSVTSANDGDAKSTDSSAGVDRARFSFDPVKVQSLAAQVLASPEVRQEKVVALQQTIANGDYSVDSNQVADAMAAELTNGRVR